MHTNNDSSSFLEPVIQMDRSSPTPSDDSSSTESCSSDSERMTYSVSDNSTNALLNDGYLSASQEAIRSCTRDIIDVIESTNTDISSPFCNIKRDLFGCIAMKLLRIFARCIKGTPHLLYDNGDLVKNCKLIMKRVNSTLDNSYDTDNKFAILISVLREVVELRYHQSAFYPTLLIDLVHLRAAALFPDNAKVEWKQKVVVVQEEFLNASRVFINDSSNTALLRCICTLLYRRNLALLWRLSVHQDAERIAPTDAAINPDDELLDSLLGLELSTILNDPSLYQLFLNVNEQIKQKIRVMHTRAYRGIEKEADELNRFLSSLSSEDCTPELLHQKLIDLKASINTIQQSRKTCILTTYNELKPRVKNLVDELYYGAINQLLSSPREGDERLVQAAQLELPRILTSEVTTSSLFNDMQEFRSYE